MAPPASPAAEPRRAVIKPRRVGSAAPGEAADAGSPGYRKWVTLISLFPLSFRLSQGMRCGIANHRIPLRHSAEPDPCAGLHCLIRPRRPASAIPNCRASGSAFRLRAGSVYAQFQQDAYHGAFHQPQNDAAGYREQAKPRGGCKDTWDIMKIEEEGYGDRHDMHNNHHGDVDGRVVRRHVSERRIADFTMTLHVQIAGEDLCLSALRAFAAKTAPNDGPPVRCYRRWFGGGEFGMISTRTRHEMLLLRLRLTARAACGPATVKACPLVCSSTAIKARAAVAAEQNTSPFNRLSSFRIGRSVWPRLRRWGLFPKSVPSRKERE